jgi:formate dehydrogenase major subunit
LTETAYLADVVLPASAWPEKTGTVTNTDRMVQLGRRALDLPGDARQDLWIIQQLANRLGLDWKYAGEDSGVAAVYEEMHIAQNSISGISWSRLNRESSVTYPCADDNDPGQPVVFIDSFATANGRAKFVPADIIPANERPDTEFPFVLITGRQLEHWHTGSMTRRASVLDAIEPGAMVSMNPMDMRRVGVAAGEAVTIASRRGHVGIAVRADEGIAVGSVFMPFAYYEAAANMLTNPALDPFGKIAELKYCAVNVTKGATMVELSSYGGGMAFTNTDAAA